MAKKRKMELTPRLQLLADWVPQGARLADIGTDHAYLPVWLLLEGRISSAIASDLRQGPLSRAQETARAYGVLSSLDLRLGDGLAGIRPEETTCIAIAGMGGENIAAILSAASWTADGEHILLLQPMTRAEELRRFLAESGYKISRERLVYDRGTIYPVIEACGGGMTLTEGQLYGGAALLNDPLEDRYLIERIVRFQAAIAGLNRSGTPEDQKKADHLRDLVLALMRMREEWRYANCQSN